MRGKSEGYRNLIKSYDNLIYSPETVISRVSEDLPVSQKD